MLDHVLLDEARSPVKKAMLVNATVLDGFVLSDDTCSSCCTNGGQTGRLVLPYILRPALEYARA
jgi:hypothetical protein